MTPAEHVKAIEDAAHRYARDFAVYCDGKEPADLKACNVSLTALQASIRAGVGAAPEGWQTIETAPKDGTRVLLVIDHGEYGDKVWTGLWADGWMVSYGKAASQPILWMPLPAAPKP